MAPVLAGMGELVRRQWVWHSALVISHSQGVHGGVAPRINRSLCRVARVRHMCLCVRVFACLPFESGSSSGHTDLIVQSLLAGFVPFATHSSPWLALVFPADGLDLVSVVFPCSVWEPERVDLGRDLRIHSQRSMSLLGHSSWADTSAGWRDDGRELSPFRK